MIAIRILAVMLVAMLVALVANPVFAKDRPNVVLFLADDISSNDLGCYGHSVIRTPNIDALASTGLRFTNAYLTTSSCSPSRCSLITGRYPHNTGAPELHTALPAGQVCFPMLLRDAGYHTVLSGKNHMGSQVQDAFSVVSKGKGPGKEADWVELLKKRPKESPFFCWFASTDAHRSWAIGKQAPVYEPDDMVVPSFLFDGPRTRKDLTGYYHEVSRFDHFVGLVCEELKSQGVFDETVIIVMADNGRPFPRCKTRLYDSGIKTPLVIHGSDRVASGVTSSLVSSIDISATILELAGVEKNERIQGVSFSKLFRDPNAMPRKVAFAEHNWHVFKNHERMVRMGNWLYIRNSFPGQLNLCREAFEDGAGEELWEMEAKGKLAGPQLNLFQNPCPKEELYQVLNDPNQITNLAEDAKYQATLIQMRAKLDLWIDQTGDSIPDSPTPDRMTREIRSADAKKKGRAGHRHQEMPGDKNNAKDILHSGPIQ